MKKFGRKLVLSGLALAATAATLSTSTYAWYVTNSTAEVNSGQVGVAGDSVSGNLLVATDSNGLYGEFTNSIDLNTSGTLAKPVTKATLVDSEGATYALTADSKYVDGTTYYTKGATTEGVTAFTVASGTTGEEIDAELYVKSNWMDVDGKAVADANACQTFSFWVLATEADAVNFTATVTNASTNTATQVLYNTEGMPTKKIVNGAITTPNDTTGSTNTTDDDVLKAFDTFKVDAGYALRFDVVKEEEGNTVAALTGENAEEVGTYGIENFTNNTYVGKDGLWLAGQAHSYFYEVAGKNPAGGIQEYTKGNSAFTQVGVTANKRTRITVTIWLEGTDTDCFDSCIGQLFNYEFDLGVATNN